ncbi:MAG TPA: hypothetical protein VFI29_00285 [Hanamia sp.]|nr:hypothetical protein [Hanamia sp.]
MEPNNFEKNIQQRLDGLKIPPSDSVWNNVEKKIAKKKKDRRIVFILFFLVLFLISGGYWLFNSIKNNSQTQNNQLSNVLKKGSKTTKREDSSLNKTVTSSGITTQKESSSNVSKEKTKALSSISKNKKAVSAINKKQEKISVKSGYGEKEGIIFSSQSEKWSNKKSIDIEKENKTVDQNNLAEKNTGTDDVKEKNSKSDFGVPAENKMSSDTLLKIKEKKSIVKKDSSAKKTVDHHQKNKWKFEIAFSGGKSMMGDGLLGTDKANYASVQSTPGTGSGNNPTVYLPSKINSSAAFIGGIFIEKNISARSKISIGVSYKYYSLLNEVGNRIDSVMTYPSQYFASSSGFYSSTNNVKTYRNNFHYLGIPISIKFQLSNSKTLPIYWDAGINISQLISSNALQFTSNPGLYYNDNSLFNKTQLGLQTGFSAILFAKTKTPLSIGPYFLYNISKLANEGLYSGKHFSFVGIRTEIFFGKK